MHTHYHYNHYTQDHHMGQGLKHIAFIMDGNGRWAEKQFLPRLVGHRHGTEKAQDICLYLKDKNIPYVSLFAFSSENNHRPIDEINILMDLICEAIEKKFHILSEHRIAVVISGDIDSLPDKVQNAISHIYNPDNPIMTVNIALNYGGKWDIVQAMQQLAKKIIHGDITADDIDEDMITQHLNHPNFPPIDLLFRSGNEKRISNFMLWQLAYSELYFTDIFWPDISHDDIDSAIDFFHQRQRRFGKII